MGFITTRTDLKVGRRSREAPPTEATLHKLGPAGVKNMNRSAKTPEMAPRGSTSPEVYILGPFPTADDDRQGEPFRGSAGALLASAIPRGGTKVTRFNNCVRTRTVGGRDANYEEIECFRPDVVEDIERTRPRVVVAMGRAPLVWALGRGFSDAVCRGRKFPVKIGQHKCWLVSSWDAQYVCDNKKERYVPNRKYSGEELVRSFNLDFKFAYDLAADNPTPVIDSQAEEDLFENVTCVLPTEKYAARRVVAALERMSAADKLNGVDIETTGIRAREAGARILSVAIGDEEGTIAFPVDHPSHPWALDDAKLVKAALIRWLKSPSQKVCHNTFFELAWFSMWLDDYEFARLSTWHDTQAQGYVLDERVGGLSLNFLCMLHLGLPLKSLSDVDVKNAKAAPLIKLLRYNALDTKKTREVFFIQRALITEQGLDGIYSLQLARIPTLVAAHHLGFGVDSEEVERQFASLTSQLQEETELLLADPAVKQCVKKFGPFNPLAADSITHLLRDIMGRDEGKQANGKYATDKGVLSKVGSEATDRILVVRQVSKLLGTYVEPLRMTSESAVIRPTGRVHPIWNTTLAGTGRLTSEDPNGQNYPKRENPQMRRCFAARPGYVLLSGDYGQIEARIFACASQDKTLTKALYENYDIHMAWARRVAELYPPTFEERGSNWKKFRNDMKTDLVFKSFYGAYEASVARSLNLPKDIAKILFREFWDTYPGIKKWQQQNQRTYDRYFYVESLTGRRRRGPLSPNQITNTPIQGTSSDVVVAAMDLLSIQAVEENKPWLQALLNIHDDLTFEVPEDIWQDALEDIVLGMLSVKFDWLTVPLSVEMDKGYNWCDMVHVGAFHSHEIFA